MSVIAVGTKDYTRSNTSLNRYSGIASGFNAFFYAIVTENVAEHVSPGKEKQSGAKVSAGKEKESGAEVEGFWE